MKAIEANSLTKFYGKSKGIQDVSFDVNTGEIFGFIGPNGAGKSTTIRTLLSLIYPTSGGAKIFGLDCIKESVKIKNNIGYIPSEVNYYDDMRTKDLLDYSSRFYNKDCSSRIKELSEIFELDLNKPIDSLSFGNKKKVSILQALIHEPRLLILDEPTGGLDPLMQNRFFEVLKEENQKGVTIFFSSHILNEVQRMCHRVAIIKNGTILKVEEIDKLRSSSYKKIRVELVNSQNLDFFNSNSIKNLTTKGNILEFIFQGDINYMIKNISLLDLENLWIEEPSLEEIFMNYYVKEGN